MIIVISPVLRFRPTFTTRNNLFDSNTCVAKFIDFGLSEIMDERGGVREPTCTAYCTRNYRCPEIYVNDAEVMRLGLGAAVDVWSMGCTLFELRSTVRLIDGAGPREVQSSLKQYIGGFSGPFGSNSYATRRLSLAGSWAKFLRRAVTPRVSQRATLQELLQLVARLYNKPE